MRTYTLLLAALAGLALAYDYKFFASPQHLCKRDDPGDSSYSLQGSDTKCHNFTEESGCTFNVVQDGALIKGIPVVASQPCSKHTDKISGVEHESPGYINSIAFFQNMDAGGRGCLFFPDSNCEGEPTHVSDIDEDKNCFEFDHRIKSFMCL